MSRYRTEGGVVEAFKWTGGHDQTEDPEWIVKALKNGVATIFTNTKGDIRMNIKASRGNLMVCSGDYIILDSDGEMCPCKSDVFDENYEMIEEESEEEDNA